MQEAGQADKIGVGVGVGGDAIPRFKQGDKGDGQGVLGARRDDDVFQPRADMEPPEPALRRLELAFVTRGLAVFEKAHGGRAGEHRPRRLQDLGVDLIKRLDQPHLDKRLFPLLLEGEALGAGIGGDKGARPTTAYSRPLSSQTL